jgi:uncharacterized protein
MDAPRILLERAKEGPLAFAGEVVVPVEDLGGEPLLSVSPLSMEGQILFSDGTYFVDAAFSYGGSLECSRCLRPYAFREESAVSLRLKPRPAAPRAPAGATEGEVELSEADLDVVFYQDPVLPFEEIAREQAIMAIPMKPLCRSECRGLCPVCGIDLNAGACACETSMPDPRFEVLKKLR